MGRLIAFGCSNTFGHGLSDCVMPNGHPPRTPSQLGWVATLGKMLQRKVVNQGIPGGSIKEAVWRFEQTEISKDDVVVILWPYYHRTCVTGYTFEDNRKGNLMIAPSIPSDLEKGYYKDYFTDEDAFFTNSIFIKYVERTLEKIGAQYYGFVHDPDEIEEYNKRGANICSLWQGYYHHLGYELTENLHLDVEGNTAFAEDIYAYMNTGIFPERKPIHKT